VMSDVKILRYFLLAFVILFGCMVLFMVQRGGIWAEVASVRDGYLLNIRDDEKEVDEKSGLFKLRQVKVVELKNVRWENGESYVGKNRIFYIELDNGIKIKELTELQNSQITYSCCFGLGDYVILSDDLDDDGKTKLADVQGFSVGEIVLTPVIK